MRPCGRRWDRAIVSEPKFQKKRMSKGSIDNLASAATVAGSSFPTTVNDPRTSIEAINPEEIDKLRAYWKEAGV